MEVVVLLKSNISAESALSSVSAVSTSSVRAVS